MQSWLTTFIPSKSIDALKPSLSAMVRDESLMKDGFKYQPATDLPSHAKQRFISIVKGLVRQYRSQMMSLPGT